MRQVWELKYRAISGAIVRWRLVDDPDDAVLELTCAEWAGGGYRGELTRAAAAEKLAGWRRWAAEPKASARVRRLEPPVRRRRWRRPL